MENIPIHATTNILRVHLYNIQGSGIHILLQILQHDSLILLCDCHLTPRAETDMGSKVSSQTNAFRYQEHSIYLKKKNQEHSTLTLSLIRVRAADPIIKPLPVEALHLSVSPNKDPHLQIACLSLSSTLYSRQSVALASGVWTDFSCSYFKQTNWQSTILHCVRILGIAVSSHHSDKQ